LYNVQKKLQQLNWKVARSFFQANKHKKKWAVLIYFGCKKYNTHKFAKTFQM